MTHKKDWLAWRTGKAWSQDQAAAYLGVELATYRNWESGRRAAPGIVARLLTVLEIMEIMAPELHATMVPAAIEQKRPGRKPKGVPLTT